MPPGAGEGSGVAEGRLEGTGSLASEMEAGTSSFGLRSSGFKGFKKKVWV